MFKAFLFSLTNETMSSVELRDPVGIRQSRRPSYQITPDFGVISYLSVIDFYQYILKLRLKDFILACY